MAPLDGREPGGSLVERDHELASLEEALANAAGGRPGLVVVQGPAGIGKTRLLAEGGRFAHGVGARTLVARGSELERELAFGVARQLFEGPIGPAGVEHLDGLAAPAREALYGPPSTGIRDVSFAVLHSLYELTVALAADSPLAIAVDDLQWCDEPSLRFLNYLVRRLEGLGIAVICTARPLERRARSALVTEIVGDPLAVSIRPRAQHRGHDPARERRPRAGFR